MEGHEGHTMPVHNMGEHNMPGHDMPGHDMPGHDMPAMCAMNVNIQSFFFFFDQI